MNPLTSKLDDLQKICEVAPEIAFDQETESGRFYSTFSPPTVLKMIETIRVMREALEKLHHGPGNKMEGWKNKMEGWKSTWAHEFSGAKLAKVEELWK